MPQVQHADPGTRRLALVLLAVAAVLGAAALVLLERYRPSLLSWFLASGSEVRVAVMVVALILLLAPVFLMAASLWRYGLRVLRDERHPPEGVKVVRDTPVSHGAAARRYGRLYQALAASFVLAGLCVLWFSWVLWRLR